MSKTSNDTDVLCIGAGPACLTASYLLSKQGVPVTVVEADPTYVGGISKTVAYNGFHFDIGGHRFFSKSQKVEDLWSELLPDDMLTRPRSSRIYYKGKTYAYPLKAFEALKNLGIVEAGLCVLSYMQSRIWPIKNPANFEDWVTNQFGRRLFNIFFRTYTEKVWGIKCSEISADWAAQRIKGLSLGVAVWKAITASFGVKKNETRAATVKSLIDSFRYPRKGPGMMWEAAARKTAAQGGQVRMGEKVVSLAYDKAAARWSVGTTAADGAQHTYTCRHVISSAPMAEVFCGLSPAVSGKALNAAKSLRYRDFITVALIAKDRGKFSDNWLYIHDPNVSVGRIQNFKSWSPEMVPDASLTCYGLEYFCFEGDEFWRRDDKDLIATAIDEMVKLGLASRDDIKDGCVIRQPKAYPVYDEAYQDHIDTMKEELARAYPNLHLVGRNGMHKYNNQDHAMMTAMLTVENIVAGKPLYDVWRVNQDAEYHETVETK